MTLGFSHTSLSSAFRPLSARIDNTVGLKYVVAGFDRLASGRGPAKVQRGQVQGHLVKQTEYDALMRLLALSDDQQKIKTPDSPEQYPSEKRL